MSRFALARGLLTPAAMTDRIAHVLRADIGLVPGNRVLLRGANCPMMAAAAFVGP